MVRFLTVSSLYHYIFGLMKSITVPVTILLFLLLNGCTLPNPSIAPEQNLRSDLELAEDYLANPRMSPVLFQFGTINEETKEFSGFLVDRYGQIRSYSLSQAPQEFTRYQQGSISKATLESLLNVGTEIRESIDVEELARRVRAYHRGSDQELDRGRDNSLAEETIAFYAYAIESSQSESGTGCSGSSHSTSQQNDGTTVLQIPLYVQGQTNLTNQSAYTEEMVQWLTGFISDQQIK